MKRTLRGDGMKPAYYNENNPIAAQWLRNLISKGHIALGDVDERSIEDVLPSDLVGYAQCHFFAGIGVWSYALRRAGWPDDKSVWTGSCPCQPFSSAGAGAGQKDIRHLWPVWIKLISACQPDIIFGEQVSSALVLGKATNESLQNLRAEFTGSRILQAYRGNSAGILQGLSSHSRQGAVRGIGQGGGHGKISPVQGNAEDYAAGELPNYRSKTASQEEGNTLRFGRPQDGNSRGDKRRGVPVIGDLFQFDGEASMEQPIIGQNNPSTGIYTGECSGSFVFSERHDARLGAGDGSGGNGGVVKKQGVKNDESRVSGAADAQDDGATGGAWLDLVFSDLEGSGYACAAVAFPSSSCGAPHIRDRLYWVGHASSAGLEGLAGDGGAARRKGPPGSVAATGVFGGLAHDNSDRCEPRREGSEAMGHGQATGADSCLGGLADTQHDGCGGQESHQAKPDGNRENFGLLDRGHFAPQGQPATGPTNGYWRDADWLYCRDGKWRPVEPGTFPLAHGAPARVGRLRAYGNAINAEAAKTFIEAVIEGEIIETEIAA